MLLSLNSLTAEQDNSTKATSKSVTQLLNYSTTHSGAITIYHASGMILHIHRYCSFLSYTEAKRRAGGYHYLGSYQATTTQ